MAFDPLLSTHFHTSDNVFAFDSLVFKQRIVSDVVTNADSVRDRRKPMLKAFSCAVMHSCVHKFSMDYRSKHELKSGEHLS